MLKPFQTYFYQAKRVFEFRIKLAQHDGGAPDMARIRSALEAYQLETVTAPRRLPIQEHRDFPQWGPCECYIIDVAVAYPAIDTDVRHILSERAGINLDWIRVYPLQQHVDTEEAEMRGQDHNGALLDEAELQDEPNAQELAGQKRVGNLMKELSARTRKYEIAGTDTTNGGTKDPHYGKTTNDVAQGNTAPIGTLKNKLQGKRGQ